MRQNFFNRSLILLAGSLLCVSSAFPKVRVTAIPFDPAAVNDPSTVTLVGQGRRGPAVLRAQILLDRANFSPGEIDGRYGKNLRNAIAAFQKVRGITENGVVGPETWQILNADTGPALLPYVISDQDLAGPFEKIPKEMTDKATLKALNFESPLEGLGEKFHSSPNLLRALNPGKRFDVAGETILAPNVAGAAPTQRAASILVSGSDNSVSALDTAGKVLARFPASAGSEHDPLPVGTWKIPGLRRNPIFFYNPALFWDADKNDSRAKIAPGPNNPVGVVWIDLSKEHYGIHGTPEPSKIGYTQSHGCIRLTNWDASKLADMVKPGTAAVLQE